MPTDVKTIKRMADIAAISIKEEELEDYAEDLNIIIRYMNQFSNIDIGESKLMDHVLTRNNVMRDDVQTNENRREELMAGAPETENGYYIVPNVVESL